ncbi:MAG TPA: hypothetical protein VKD90_21940 [Gemmataceae bacterium]|nr:hypothetical protein [Gemmataceae bacterium]
MSPRPLTSFGVLTGTVVGVVFGAGSGMSQAPPEAPKQATLAEVRRAIDWAKFPKPPGATWEETDLFRTAYFAPGKPDAVADFLRKAMAAEGWAEEKRPYPDTEPDKYRSLTFGKTGQLVEAFLEAKTETVKVNLMSRGNPDARRLPRPADTKVTAEDRSGAHFATASRPDGVAEFCRKEFAGQGWRFVPTTVFAEEGTASLRFVQAAMGIDVRATKNAAGGRMLGTTRSSGPSSTRPTWPPSSPPGPARSRSPGPTPFG